MSPSRYVIITWAALFASPIAAIAMSAPLFVASPIANTPSTLVLNVLSSAAIVPLLVSSMSSNPFGFTICPIALITQSTTRVSVTPSFGIGDLLPLASGSPSSITCSVISSWPFSSFLISIGFTSSLNTTPSSSASTISISSAGI